ncbi:MAG: ABC transporter ATP-binding protein [Pseudomonadota bacterium]
MAGEETKTRSGVTGGGAMPTLKALLDDHRLAMAAVVTCSVLAAALEVAPAVIVSQAAQRLLDGRADQVSVLAGVLLAVMALTFGLHMISALVSHLVALDVQASLRKAVGMRLLRAPLGDVEQIEPGAVRRVLMEDVERIEDGIAHLIPDLAAALVAPLVVIAVMFFFDWRLALTAIVPVVFAFVAFAAVMRSDNGLSRQFSDSQAEIAAALQEAVSMVPVIKAFNVRQSALQRQNRAFEAYRAVVGTWLSSNMNGTNAFFLATTSTLLIVFPFGLFLLHQGQADISTLLFFAMAAFGLTSIGARLFGAIGRLRIQEATVSRISQLLELPQMPEGSQAPKGDDLCVEDLSFSPGNGFELSNVNLHIPAGSRVALAGPSGSGKSTLARLLLRFHDPDKGRITLGGKDLRDLDPETLSAKISAVFQDVFLFSKSIRQNIALGKSDAPDREVIDAAKRAHADSFIQETPEGYGTVLERGEGLSGGQRQRVSLARALLKDAPIVVLDEATAYADPESEFEIQKALDEMTRGKTVIAIAHRLSTIRHFDKIVYLMRGRVVEQGTHEELLALNGHYARQWQAHREALEFKL